MKVGDMMMANIRIATVDYSTCGFYLCFERWKGRREWDTCGVVGENGIVFPYGEFFLPDYVEALLMRQGANLRAWR